MFAAGALAYMIATFNGGYVWHLVLFNDMYLALKTWTRLDAVVVPLGVAAVCLQVSEFRPCDHARQHARYYFLCVVHMLNCAHLAKLLPSTS